VECGFGVWLSVVCGLGECEVECELGLWLAVECAFGLWLAVECGFGESDSALSVASGDGLPQSD